jgi:hypothetical protein
VLKVWRSIEVFLPSGMSHDEVRIALRDGIISAANDSGDFVREFRIGASVAHSDEWRKWTASYLNGPPGIFRY